MNDALAEWNCFFAPQGTGVGRNFQIIRKRGETLLLLPMCATTAARCLSLYPAQTLTARTARVALRLALLARVPLPRVRLPWDDSAPLSAFLREQSGHKEPEFGILLGNPRAEGRRWMIALFSNGQPHRVVKAGVTSRARELIATEAVCLASLPLALTGKPTVRGTLGDTALALDFAPGHAPRSFDHRFAALLSSWLDTSRHATLANIPAWKRVRASAADPEMVARIERGIGEFHPTVMHGDFAPWNIRVSRERVTVLDWERGELTGVPGWDWLHYAVQTRVLVARKNAQQTLAEVRTITRGSEFQQFAQISKIVGREAELLISYLLHATEVTRQVDGIETMRELLTLSLRTDT